jgi:hypothetical protein
VGSGVGVNEYDELPDADRPVTSPVRLSDVSLPDTTTSDPANILRNFLLVSVDRTTCKGKDGQSLVVSVTVREGSGTELALTLDGSGARQISDIRYYLRAITVQTPAYSFSTNACWMSGAIEMR